MKPVEKRKARMEAKKQWSVVRLFEWSLHWFLSVFNHRIFHRRIASASWRCNWTRIIQRRRLGFLLWWFQNLDTKRKASDIYSMILFRETLWLGLGRTIRSARLWSKTAQEGKADAILSIQRSCSHTWKLHISVSSTDIIAPALSNSPQ